MKQKAPGGFGRAPRFIPWVIVILFISTIFIFGATLNMPGLGQRLVMIAILGWHVLMARALQTGDLYFG